MSVFNFELLKVPFASGAILSEIEPFPDYVRGLGIAFEQTDGKPEMKGLNGLFNAITASMLSLRQRGISEWVTDFDYPVGGFAVESGKLYQAKTLNTSKKPSISQSDWMLWASVSDITVHNNGNIKKTSSPNGAFELKVDDANTTTKGAARFATATEVANRTNVSAAITPANVGQTFGQSLSENGWCRLPNGLIMQWGKTTGVVGSVDFSQAFNSVFFVTASPIHDVNISDGQASQTKIKSFNNTSFSYSCGVESGNNDTFNAASLDFTWFAIGY